jgi:TPR repeat protein
MRALSDMYIYGRGVGRDANEGVRLLRKAAETGSAEAEQDLANLLFVGAPGVAQDRKEAVRWMAGAGSHGNTEAMRIVSYWLITGPSGVEPNRSRLTAGLCARPCSTIPMHRKAQPIVRRWRTTAAVRRDDVGGSHSGQRRGGAATCRPGRCAVEGGQAAAGGRCVPSHD